MNNMLPHSDDIAEICYNHFNVLPKKGKPQLNKEWTLLASVVMSKNNKLEVVSMATGTKCLGELQLSSQGDVLSDSHAEVLARRSFIRFLYHHIMLLIEKKYSDVLEFDESFGKFSLKRGISFYFFITHVPCGDASIFPKNCTDMHGDATEPKSKKIKMDSQDESTNLIYIYEKEKFPDIYRTGAKCVKEGLQDPKAPGAAYHVVGVLRTKPGRGIPTLCMSCSDKIALWNVCGLQGALLSHFLTKPIYISAFIFGKCPFDEAAFERAVFSRIANITNLPSSYNVNKPKIMQSSISFKYCKENIIKVCDKAVPCSSSIIWCNAPGSFDVSVNGIKQGVTKKNKSKPSSRVFVCKIALFQEFLSIAEKMIKYDEMYNKFKDLTYLECKQLAKDYQSAKKEVFKVFQSWVHKPISLQNFKCSLDKY